MDNSQEISVSESKIKEWKAVEDVLASALTEQKPARLHVLNEIFKAALKLAKESPGTLNLKITATVLKELRYSFKMFYPHRATSKITIFGSARTPRESPLYEFAKKFAVEAARRDYMIITGGGPGIMAAGNEGAANAGFGLNIRLPFEQAPNPFIDQKNMLIHYKYFFTRKLFLVKEASAFAFFPGGFGTFDEAFEVLTLLQTGKTSLIPVVFLEPRGYGFWDAFWKFVDNQVMKRGFISPNDKHLFEVLNSPKTALDHIDLFYRVYHSMRFVGDKLSIRLKKAPSAKILGEINRKFASLSLDESIVLSSPLPEEMNEPELKDLPRVVFQCDRKDFAGLRRLIDFLNKNC
jgi:uncharacterized protein (TIGR00730 family)